MHAVLHWTICPHRRSHRGHFKCQMALARLRLCCMANYAAALLLSVTLAVFPRVVIAQLDPETLLNRAAAELNSGSETAKTTLEELKRIEPSLSSAQKARYFTLLSSSYAFRGLRKEQVEVSSEALKSVAEPDQRAPLLYHLADGYASLGQYENALHAMNDSIVLLPKLSDLKAKVEVLQSAVSLLESLRAYDEAASYAERIVALPANGRGLSKCVGSTDLVELAYLKHDRSNARLILVDAMKACDAGGYRVMTRILRTLDAVDRLESGENATILQDSLGLLSELTKANERSDYNIQLADAIARRFLAIGQLTQAELYGKRAMQWADSGNTILLRRQTSETMAAIMRAQGKLEQALTYLDISQSLWVKLLEERSRKDMAFQRMKFQAQDQSIQLKLLGQVNALLTSERELQERNKHILELLVAVTALLLVFVSVWLMRMWRQKNDYRTFSQIDGLTNISNRTHLMACATEVFKDARGSIAVVLFDMDEFKQVNDTYNHATGDWVLQTVSATISHCLRAHDLFGRIGGEEFAICLPNTPEHEAMALAERCRGAIAAIDSAPSGFNFSITASFGIAVRPPGGAANLEATLARADQALYRAKHLGRNRIETFGEMFTHMEATN